ncbi:hypothetical protein [Amycolatopsis sp. lyj-112]|uniref:hypothetical protein n=1 Tax=Amycolatopsis sp. lyj-112 TaxID=2789288 RepID=UPI003979CAE9
MTAAADVELKLAAEMRENGITTGTPPTGVALPGMSPAYVLGVVEQGASGRRSRFRAQGPG